MPESMPEPIVKQCRVIAPHEAHHWNDGICIYVCDGKLDVLNEWTRPAHYGGEDNPFEPIKIIEHYNLNFNEGSVLKYLLRDPNLKILEHEGWGVRKDTHLAQRVEDLKKAYTYLGFEIRRLERVRSQSET